MASLFVFVVFLQEKQIGADKLTKLNGYSLPAHQDRGGVFGCQE